MTAFSDALLLLSPQVYWPLDFPPGATSTDSIGTYPVTMTLNSGVGIRTPSIVPSEPTTTCISQDQGTWAAATSAGNFFVPNNVSRLTLGCWYSPFKLKGSCPLVTRFGSYDERADASKFFFETSGTGGGGVSSPGGGDVVNRNGVYFVAMVLDGPAGTMKGYVNGVPHATLTVSTSYVTPSSSTALRLMGWNEFGTVGASGIMQHAWVTGTAFTEAQIQALYLAGVKTGSEDLNKGYYVFPWPRTVITQLDPLRTYKFQNLHSMTDIWVNFDAPATRGNGWRLRPFETSPALSGSKSYVSCVSDNSVWATDSVKLGAIVR